MAEEITGTSVDAIQLLTFQHREVSDLWSQVQASNRGGQVDASAAQEIVTKLSQHDAIETQFLYPELRKVGDEGAQLADYSLDEHRRVRELLSEVDGKDPRDAAV